MLTAAELLAMIDAGSPYIPEHVFANIRSAIEAALAEAHEAGVLEGATVRGMLEHARERATP